MQFWFGKNKTKRNLNRTKQNIIMDCKTKTNLPGAVLCVCYPSLVGWRQSLECSKFIRPKRKMFLKWEKKWIHFQGFPRGNYYYYKKTKKNQTLNQEFDNVIHEKQRRSFSMNQSFDHFVISYWFDLIILESKHRTEKKINDDRWWLKNSVVENHCQ